MNTKGSKLDKITWPKCDIIPLMIAFWLSKFCQIPLFGKRVFFFCDGFNIYIIGQLLGPLMLGLVWLTNEGALDVDHIFGQSCRVLTNY